MKNVAFWEVTTFFIYCWLMDPFHLFLSFLLADNKEILFAILAPNICTLTTSALESLYDWGTDKHMTLKLVESDLF
jgi:hypothetical protein